MYYPTRILFILFFFTIYTHASKAQLQEITPDDSATYRNQTDLVDILQRILHKPENRNDRTGSGKKGKSFVSIFPAIGYSLQTDFAVLLAASTDFYMDKTENKNPNQKVSNIITSSTYTLNNQFILPLHANLWTKNNNYNYLIDWRYMQYPSIIYGLNDQTSLKSGYTINFQYAKIHQSVFKSIGNNLYAGLGYYLDHLWNIKEIGLKPTDRTIFQEYGLTSSEIASGPVFRLMYDSRLNQGNPRNGMLANIAYRPNFTFLGSRNNWQSILVEFRKYIKLTKKSKNILALWNYNWLTAGGKPPYLLLPSTGWDDSFNTGRGYIQGRFRGRNMIYFESEYRFGITRNGLLGAVVFANVQSFSGDSNFKFNAVAPAFGGGLRFKLNKFSGTNICIDYGIGTNGSRGFFVNLNEVF